MDCSSGRFTQRLIVWEAQPPELPPKMQAWEAPGEPWAIWVNLLLGKVCVGHHASQACLYYPDSGRNAGSLAKGSAVKSISSIT
jgi:hypothetical protein